MSDKHVLNSEERGAKRASRILKASLAVFVGIIVLAVTTAPKDVFKWPVGWSGLRLGQPQKPVPSGYLPIYSVVDGDTVEVWRYGRPQKVRLIGMDTPEIADPRRVVQCFGREASARAHSLLDGKNVRLELDPGQGEIDKYGRLLAYLFMEDGLNYNQYMIEQGFAHEYTYQSQPYKYQAQFKQAQQSAREQKRGFWADDTCAGDTKQPAK